jgi:hypothetical protein
MLSRNRFGKYFREMFYSYKSSPRVAKWPMKDRGRIDFVSFILANESDPILPFKIKKALLACSSIPVEKWVFRGVPPWIIFFVPAG